MCEDLSNWQARPRPRRIIHTGRLVRLEPLEADRHGDDLYTASTPPDGAQRFAWLAEDCPSDRQSFEAWLVRAAASEDPLYFGVVDLASGRVEGRQTLMRIDPSNGVIEIGAIYWGPGIARRPQASEALYLFARHVFEDLGYRRFEWKCNSLNEPSKRAALRFGFTFEGIFRQHMVVKGTNRDTAWFAMMDKDWPRVKRALEAWLDPGNFDPGGLQRKRLQTLHQEGQGGEGHG